jgi:uncharacterized protein with HEPN domain
MKRDDLTFIGDARDAARKAIEIAGRQGRENLPQDEVIALAVVRLLEIIGEAANFISRDFKEKYPEIPWRRMIDTRNRLIHAYFEVKTEVIWETVTNDLPPLESSLTAILKAEGRE